MAECGYCKDCKWWTGADWGICQRFNTYGRQSMRPGALARLWTTTKRGSVMFETGADFGCVQFEEDEKEAWD